MQNVKIAQKSYFYLGSYETETRVLHIEDAQFKTKNYEKNASLFNTFPQETKCILNVCGLIVQSMMCMGRLRF